MSDYYTDPSINSVSLSLFAVLHTLVWFELIRVYLFILFSLSIFVTVLFIHSFIYLFILPLYFFCVSLPFVCSSRLPIFAPFYPPLSLSPMFASCLICLEGSIECFKSFSK